MKNLTILFFALAALALAQNPMKRDLSCTAASASSTDYTCSIATAPSGYVTGEVYRFKADVANTAATGKPTINFNSLGAKAIVKVQGGVTTALAANDIQSGQWVSLTYDGTNMQMTSQLGNAPAGSGTVNSGALNQMTHYASAGAAVSGFSFPNHYIIPAANCVSSTAGAGWNTGLTPACVAGSNNLGGTLPFVDTSTAQFDFELPADWDTTQQPYIALFFSSGTNTSGTVIFNVATACSKADGSVSSDPAFTTADSFTTKTMAAASRGWSTSVQMTQVTSGNNCVPGGSMLVKITRATDTASAAVQVQKAVITVPRLPVVQAN